MIALLPLAGATEVNRTTDPSPLLRRALDTKNSQLSKTSLDPTLQKVKILVGGVICYGTLLELFLNYLQNTPTLMGSQGEIAFRGNCFHAAA